jgi:hypothetical protein
MDMDPQILVELTKIISEQNKNLVRIEKNLVQQNLAKDKTRFRTVQLGSNDLIINRPKNYQISEAQQQQIFEQLCQIEQQKKLYNQLVTEEPLAGSKSSISEDNLDGLLQLKGGELSPLTKILFRIVLIWTMDNSSTTTKGFMPGQINPGFGHPGTAGPAPRIAPKLQENPINRNNPGQGACRKSSNYSETVKFNDGYKAEIGNVQLDHILVKHGHQWGIDDIDLKNTKDANNNLFPGKLEQIRTRLTPENREKLLTGIQDKASSSKLELYPNYPISGGMGQGYLCPETGLFIGIDKNNIIRKAYVASENLINYLRTNCT